MEVVFVGIYLLVVGIIWYRNRRKVSFGVLHDKADNVYTYAFGNYLAAEFGTFHGIDITLPGSMANFYLDSHADSKRRGPGRLFDGKQKLSLEGDFDKHFQLFVPRDSETLALSILSPDVMQTLMGSAERYDVELYGNHLRLLALRKVYGDPAIQADLYNTAQTVLEEISQRQANWQATDHVPQKLIYRRGSTFKVGKRYILRSHAFIALGFLLLGIVAVGFSLSGYYTYQDPHFNDPYSKGFVQGTFMYAAAVIFIAAIPLSLLGALLWLVGYRSTPDTWPRKSKR